MISNTIYSKNKLSVKGLMQLYNSNLNYKRNVAKWNREHQKCQRQPNINEGLTEGIVQLFINDIEERECYTNKNKSGDLVCGKSSIEVKCFSTNTPISFGSSKWDELYIVNAMGFDNNFFEIYKCKLSNISKKFQNLKLYGGKTYADFYKSGKRCKITFLKLKDQLKTNLKLVFSGSIHDLEK